MKSLGINKNHISLFVLIAILVPYLLLSAYCNPIADDFTYSLRGKENPLFATLMHEFFNWNGRYFSNILVLNNPLVYGSLCGYKVVPLVLILLTFISFYSFVYSVCYEVLKKIETVTIALLVAVLFLYQMPLISQGIYWYTGAVTYQLGNIFLLLFASLLILHARNKLIFNSKIIHVIAMSVASIITIGSNEISMLLCLSLMLAFYTSSLIKKEKDKKTLLFLLLLVLSFSALVFFAPGNKVRETYSSEKHQLFRSLFYSFAQTGRFMTEWIISLPLIVISIFYFFFHRSTLVNIKIVDQSFYLSPLISILLLFFVVFITIFPAYWSMGMLGQHRTINVAYFCFLILWFINLSVCFNFAKNKIKPLSPPKPFIRYLLIVLSIYFLTFSRNGYNAVSDLWSGKAKDFDTQMNSRMQMMEHCNKNTSDTITFSAIKNPPISLFVIDIQDNPEHWSNRGYAVYFKAEKKIIMKK